MSNASQISQKLTVIALGVSTMAVNCQLVLAQVKTPAIDLRASQILQTATNTLKNAKSLSFQANISFDDVAPENLSIQYNATAQVFVERPNHFLLNYVGDRRNVSFIFDGKEFTLWDHGRQVYGSFLQSGNNDSALARTAKEFDFLVPLTDVIYSDPANLLRGKVQKGYYLGESSLSGIPVHHLAFKQENLDWEIWIDTSKQALLRKLLITYKKLPGAPQYTAIFSDWNLDWQVPRPDFFSFKPPKDAIKIDFLAPEK